MAVPLAMKIPVPMVPPTHFISKELEKKGWERHTNCNELDMVRFERPVKLCRASGFLPFDIAVRPHGMVVQRCWRRLRGVEYLVDTHYEV